MSDQRPPHLARLERIWADSPIYFVTTCLNRRSPLLSNPDAADILIREWRRSGEIDGWLVGRYVIMPDHVHFFCASAERPGEGTRLSKFLQSWKQWSSKRLHLQRPELDLPIWQARFFDHMLRSAESYQQKWEYVYQNPARGGLVPRAEAWPYQGEIGSLELR